MFVSSISKIKVFDKFHISSIFLCQDVILDVIPDVIYCIWMQCQDVIPEPLLTVLTDGKIPVLTVKLTEPIRIKMLNYRDTVQAISVITNDELFF